MRGIETVAGPQVAEYGTTSTQWLNRLHRRQLINSLTFEKYGYHMRSLGRYLDPEIPLQQITHDDIEGWLSTG